jgi:hypothetical protein
MTSIPNAWDPSIVRTTQRRFVAPNFNQLGYTGDRTKVARLPNWMHNKYTG